MTLTLTVPPKVTPRAFARLAEINAATGDAKALRIAVDGGGVRGSNTTSALTIRPVMIWSWNMTGKRSWSTACPCPFWRTR